MKKLLLIIIGILILGVVGFVLFGKKQPVQVGCTMEAKVCPDGSAVGRSGPTCEFAPCPDVSTKTPTDASSKISAPEFVAPLERAGERVTKKPFGIFIDPKTSPIQPEKFRGYHTGTDFETFPEEAKSDVPVRAICSGSLETKRSATGYGGVVVQKCEFKNELITVIYGHMRLTSVEAAIGKDIAAGDIIGVLGTGGSKETDGERKHLHLGIHKGNMVNIRGYIASKSELSEWLDACQLFSCSL
ncbi:MAG: M23 family metallopeptidase [Candidatus Moranbacteria bacterium]|nr:M23 family metallopeptidase [Candidatus Moranbacteria bacterium]